MRAPALQVGAVSTRSVVGVRIRPPSVMIHGVPLPARSTAPASARASLRLASARGSTAFASMLCGHTVSIAG